MPVAWEDERRRPVNSEVAVARRCPGGGSNGEAPCACSLHGQWKKKEVKGMGGREEEGERRMLQGDARAPVGGRKKALEEARWWPLYPIWIESLRKGREKRKGIRADRKSTRLNSSHAD